MLELGVQLIEIMLLIVGGTLLFGGMMWSALWAMDAIKEIKESLHGRR